MYIHVEKGVSLMVSQWHLRKDFFWIFLKIIDMRKTTWYGFLKKRNYFKGKPAERQGRKARRG